MTRLAQTFGANVKRLRLAKGLSQEALTDLVELAVTYVGQIERGRRNPTLGVVERFARVFEADPWTCCGNSGKTPVGAPCRPA